MKLRFMLVTLSLFLITFAVSFLIGINFKNKKEPVLEIANNSVVVENKKEEIILSFEDLPKDELTREELIDPFLNMVAQINKEKLPFDEPRTEFGQQDGHLRLKWRDAFFTKKLKYKFNGDTYYVYGRYPDTKKLYPLVPQVCSDFLVDSIDRSLGNWYYPSPRKPRTIKGNFSIRQQAKEYGYDLRRLPDLVKYMRKHPEYFEFIFEGDGFPIGDTDLLKRWFKSIVEVEVGDLVIISGKVPWDKRELHSHSFIITQIEDGYVKKISGNAGIAREWDLYRESKRTPLRTVKYVVRLKKDLLIQMRKDN